MNDTDLDNAINWQQFYGQYFRDMKPAGSNKMLVKCPFHTDEHASMWFNTKNGLWKCEACGESGNATTFLAKKEGIDNTEAYKMLLKYAGLYKEGGEKKTTARYTVEEYCAQKHFQLEYIIALGVKNSKSGNYINIPYMDESGVVVATKQRYNPKSSMRFSWLRGSKLHPYGLWKMEQFRKKGYIVLVEGESDAQTLWLYDVPALGIPGASTFKADWTEYIRGLKVYIFQEPDLGGETFVKGVCKGLATKNFENEVYAIQIPGMKDASELHIQDAEHFVKHWENVMKDAKQLNIEEYSTKPEEIMPGCPVSLRMPVGWNVSDKGIMFLDKDMQYTVVCRTPILISSRMRSVDTGEEKIEIVFFRDGEWQNEIVQRSTLFQSRTITQLADIGITVTSENAKFIVKFLGELEAENIDLIPVKKCVSQMGWYGRDFIPFINDKYTIDVDPTSRRWVNAYRQNGDLREWVDYIAPYRENYTFRFALAASFAAPLLKLLNQRIFFVHLWGDSRTGKTAALKAALSVWGDPEGLLTSFNATRVGLERMAGLFNDLPLGIDEKQVANKQEFVEQLVYMLSSGASKVRGTKGGGLDSMKTWRSVIFTTGEEPLTTTSSSTGIATRILEINSKPFENEMDAAFIHETVGSIYGSAGPEFLRNLVQEDINDLRDRLEKYKSMLTEKYTSKLMSHMSDIALVMLTDELISEWIFKDEDVTGTIKMAENILKELEDIEETDVVSKAYEFTKGWIMSNEKQFTIEAREPRYGIEENGIYYVFPQILEKALKDAGFNYKKTMWGFAKRGLIYTTNVDKERYAVVKKYNGKAVRFIMFDLTSLENEEETPPF